MKTHPRNNSGVTLVMALVATACVVTFAAGVVYLGWRCKKTLEHLFPPSTNTNNVVSIPLAELQPLDTTGWSTNLIYGEETWGTAPLMPIRYKLSVTHDLIHWQTVIDLITTNENGVDWQLTNDTAYPMTFYRTEYWFDPYE